MPVRTIPLFLLILILVNACATPMSAPPEVAQPTPPPVDTAAPPSTSQPEVASYAGVSFAYDPSLAESIAGQTRPQFIDPSGFIYNSMPEHIRFDFTNPYTFNVTFAPLQQWSAPWYLHQNPMPQELRPQIFVFRTEDYENLSPEAGQRIAGLQALLGAEQIPVDDELPVLPMFNAAQDVRIQAGRIQFENGSGIRFLTRYTQGVEPVINPNVFYTFQGLTEDGEFYISAFFPLYEPSLPNEINVTDWEAFNAGYQDYLADTIRDLDAIPQDAFEPDLAMLDALVRSLAVSWERPGTAVP